MVTLPIIDPYRAVPSSLPRPFAGLAASPVAANTYFLVMVVAIIAIIIDGAVPLWYSLTIVIREVVGFDPGRAVLER